MTNWSNINARVRMRRNGALSPMTGEGFRPGGKALSPADCKADLRAEAERAFAEFTPDEKKDDDDGTPEA